MATTQTRKRIDPADLLSQIQPVSEIPKRKTGGSGGPPSTIATFLDGVLEAIAGGSLPKDGPTVVPDHPHASAWAQRINDFSMDFDTPYSFKAETRGSDLYLTPLTKKQREDWANQRQDHLDAVAASRAAADNGS